MSIRTTVTLDDDVAERVKRQSQARGTSFRETLNELLRLALANTEATPQPREFRIKATNMGYRPELNYDDIEGLLEKFEGIDHR